ncbi:glycosyltransferase family 2 protein [Emticicia sp. SJ17W-69]|uniref:glycosyltransferase family 2 protein n=1 Tax=Emticicia sp. SJ17W-69 TaxID=3421657 RepID=UPI003EBFC3DA
MDKFNEIKVSVLILTYNHEKFIKKAIESVLNQKTDFEFELIIADDNSTDTTQNIIIETLASIATTSKVRYIRNAENLGVMRSWRNIHNMICGQYFAICEGDDYWIDELKLQKQVDFLDTNQSFSICFHNVKVDFIDIPQANYLLNDGLVKDVFTLDDLIGNKEIWFMATASLMIRTNSLKSIPDWVIKSKSGDIPLIILASLHGKIKYLPNVMAVYQKHSAGMSMTDHKDDTVFLKNRIFMYRMINKETRYRYNRKLRENIASYYYLMLSAKQLRNSYFKKLIISFYYIFLTFPNTPQLKSVLKDHIIPLWAIKLSRILKRKLGLIPLNDAKYGKNASIQEL